MIDIYNYKCIVIGISAGGMEILRRFLPLFPSDFPVPIVIVQHFHPNQGEFFIKYLDSCCNMNILEASDKEMIKKGNIYFAPPNYHLLIEENYTFSLNVDAKVNFSRPSIDVLFYSAADAYSSSLIGIIMTGANDDGSRGIRYIKERGGVTIVQDPDTAEVFTMPLAAVESSKIDYILPVENIAGLFI
ncbi:MAG: chemotaxis protein CheB [Bacteroidia bacterium]|nr:chemotaxis protein CheB [Bacteroidia bacterium]